MKPSEILQLLRAAGKEIFGAPVFILEKVVSQNITSPVLFAKNGSPYIQIVNENNPNDKDITFLKRGVDPKKPSFDIAKFVAERDAKGTTNGKEWSVTKGAERFFAI